MGGGEGAYQTGVSFAGVGNDRTHRGARTQHIEAYEPVLQLRAVVLVRSCLPAPLLSPPLLFSSLHLSSLRFFLVLLLFFRPPMYLLLFQPARPRFCLERSLNRAAMRNAECARHLSSLSLPLLLLLSVRPPPLLLFVRSSASMRALAIS